MITVGLPVYKQKGILHIALESLCRQENAGEWELIISSEDDIWDVVESYRLRLAQAGCKRLYSDKLTQWIPLPRKWRRIGRIMNGEGSGMILHAADCYSHPSRLHDSHKAMKEGYKWYHESKGYFYCVNNGLLVYYDNSSMPVGSATHLNMCISNFFARKLPISDKKAGIDGWMFNTIPLSYRKIYQKNTLSAGVDIHGMNNISKKRGKFIVDCTKAFKRTELSLSEIGLPEDVVKMINDLK